MSKSFAELARYDEVPNLDAMDQKALAEFWVVYRDPSRQTLRRFIPKDVIADEDAARDASATLACYAIAKSCAMDLRLKGNIEAAGVYEEHCDSYYQDLPEVLRW